MSINHQKSVTAEAVALSQLSGCQTQLDQLRTELERRQDQWARIEQLKDRERQSQVSIDVLRKAEAAANAECDALSSLRTAAQERHDAEMAAVREKLEALADQPSQQLQSLREHHGREVASKANEYKKLSRKYRDLQDRFALLSEETSRSKCQPSIPQDPDTSCSALSAIFTSSPAFDVNGSAGLPPAEVSLKVSVDSVSTKPPITPSVNKIFENSTMSKPSTMLEQKYQADTKGLTTSGQAVNRPKRRADLESCESPRGSSISRSHLARPGDSGRKLRRTDSISPDTDNTTRTTRSVARRQSVQRIIPQNDGTGSI
ncbi:hypothetical protein EMMF5_001739 [Cystobasidiomycetes sp. EMM_F5]